MPKTKKRPPTRLYSVQFSRWELRALYYACKNMVEAKPSIPNYDKLLETLAWRLLEKITKTRI